MENTGGIYSCYNCSLTFSNEDELIDYQMDTLTLATPDQYILAIGAPIAFLCTFFIVYTFYKYPETRRLPGDIILAISLCECVLSVHWFMFAVFSFTHEKAPDPYGSFCQINAFLSLMAGAGEFIYNVAFCIYLNVQLTKLLKLSPKFRAILHACCLLVMVLVPILANITDNTGLNLFGTCSFKQKNSFPYGALVLVGVYMMVSIYTILFYKKTVLKQTEQNQELLEKKKSFLIYYMNYIIASCVIWTVLALCNLMAGLNCEIFFEDRLDIFITIGNTAKLATPIVLSIMRYKDPNIKKKLKQFFTKVQIEQMRIQNPSIDFDFYNMIQSELKSQQVTSIITGIRKAYSEVFTNYNTNNNSSINYSDGLQLSDPTLQGAQQKRISYDKNDLVYLEQQWNVNKADFKNVQTFEVQGESMMHMKISIHAPKLFNILLQRDSNMINPFESLDPLLNQKQLEKFQNPDGGKSGEFFFFSYDNKLILKTMSNEELFSLKQRLPMYFTHLLQNESMITPFYGLFTFERVGAQVGMQDKFNVYLMRNVSQCPGKYIIRTFDMKGSELDREVLKGKPADVDLSSLTLKDTDFQKTEQTIKISPQDSSRVREALLRDAEFFMKMGLMDYSLLVFKIDWRLYILENHGENIEMIRQRFNSDIHIIASVDEPGVYYHMAVIDYLQEWTINKKMEKGLKQMRKNEDPSAQDPQTYGKRFQTKLVQQIFI